VTDGPRRSTVWGDGIGWPGFAEMAESYGGARFIAPDAARSRAFRAKTLFLKPLRFLRGPSYPIRRPPILVGRFVSFILASRESAG